MILYEKETPYNQIKVVEEDSIRKLLFGPGMSQEQSAIDLYEPNIHVFDYSFLAMHSLLFVHRPSRILVTGLGGGVIPQYLSRYFPDVSIDIIEIDPEVVNVAKEFFSFQETDKIKVHIGDAFQVVSQLEEKYDIVILDAFQNQYVPFHLMSIEFFKMVNTITKVPGVVVANMCNGHPSFFSQINTFRSVMGGDIYRLNGFKNHYCSMLYAPKGHVNLLDGGNMNCHFLMLCPFKQEMTDEIKTSQIFSLSGI